MKKKTLHFTLLSFLFSLLVLPSQAQVFKTSEVEQFSIEKYGDDWVEQANYLTEHIELDKNNRLSFSRVIQCGRKDADKLYELLDEWFTKTFSDKLDGRTDPEGIATSSLIDNDWMASIQMSVTFDFKERCIECHNQKNQMRR